MGGLIETLLSGLLGGVLALLGVLLAGWQERKRAREAREARKEEMVYEKQLIVLEEAIKNLVVMNEKLRKVFSLSVKQGVLVAFPTSREEYEIATLESLELQAKISAYLPMETSQAWVDCGLQASEITREVASTLRDGGKVDMEQIEDRLNDTYSSAVMKMREHLGIKKHLQPRKDVVLKV